MRWKISLTISTHDFIGIIHNDDNLDESDIEIDLKLTEK